MTPRVCVLVPKAYKPRALGAPTAVSKEVQDVRNAIHNPINNPINNPTNNPIYDPIRRAAMKRKRMGGRKPCWRRRGRGQKVQVRQLSCWRT
jgi:hypothetical protein